MASSKIGGIQGVSYRRGRALSNAVLEKTKASHRRRQSSIDMEELFDTKRETNKTLKFSERRRPRIRGRVQNDSESKESFVNAQTARKLLCERFSRKFKTVRRAFRLMDTDHDGSVSFQELRQTMKDLNINVTHSTFRDMIDSMKKDVGMKSSKEFQYEEFRKLFGESILGKDSTPFYTALHGTEDRRRRMSQVDRRKAPQKFVTAESARKQLCEHLNASFKSVRKAFRHFDHDFDGSFSVDELREALAEYNIFVKNSEFKKLVAMMGTLKQRGKIDFEAFRQLFGESISAKDSTPFYTRMDGKDRRQRRISQYGQSRKAYMDAQTAARTFCRALHTHYHSVREAFRRMDTDYSNSISLDELRKSLQNFNIEMRDEEFDKLVGRMLKGKGFLEYEDFRELFGKHIDNLASSPVPRGRRGSYLYQEPTKIGAARATRRRGRRLSQVVLNAAEKSSSCPRRRAGSTLSREIDAIDSKRSSARPKTANTESDVSLSRFEQRSTRPVTAMASTSSELSDDVIAALSGGVWKTVRRDMAQRSRDLARDRPRDVRTLPVKDFCRILRKHLRSVGKYEARSIAKMYASADGSGVDYNRMLKQSIASK